MFGEVSPNMLREHSALISNAMSCDKYLKAKISSAHNPLATVSRRAARLFALPLGVATREVLSMEPAASRARPGRREEKTKLIFNFLSSPLFMFIMVVKAFVVQAGTAVLLAWVRILKCTTFWQRRLICFSVRLNEGKAWSGQSLQLHL